MKRLGMAFILTCALSVAALAGDVPTAGAPVVPPPPTTQSSTGSVATTLLLTVLSLIR
jgi:hypothetical protein